MKQAFDCLSISAIVTFLFGIALAGSANASDRVQISNGVVEGVVVQSTGVRIFKGIPFAQPPVGDLRWKPPQPVKNWEGVRSAFEFGPRCMQHPVYDDMIFRDGMSEDCLYLNVWTPYRTMGVSSVKKLLPVLVYIYGGGFVAGSSSEPRYDGEALAARGIVFVSMNYRLGVFGFLAHPELTKESPNHASGDYGLLDQNAAFQWVQQNIAAFGGDPKRVTIGGESVGSISVSAHMVSPLSKDLIHGAIGESGSILGSHSAVPLAEGEKQGLEFAASVGATSLAALRAMTSEKLLEATSKTDDEQFSITVDGYFLPESPWSLFGAGKQAHIPLLVGWNSAEDSWKALLWSDEPTPENFGKAVKKLYGDRADEALKLYQASTRDEVVASATDLASDRYMGYSTWKWSDAQIQTGGSALYRYLYARGRPAVNAAIGKTADPKPSPVPPTQGAVHSTEIEYALGNLATNKVYEWTPEDYKLSDLMQEYFANFVKYGDPNEKGLPKWPANKKGSSVLVMRLDVESRAEPEKHRDRYLFLDSLK